MKTFLKKSSTVLIAVAGLALINQACTESKGGNTSIPKASAPIPVRIITLEKTLAETSITTSGRVSTDDETLLGFKVGGVVQHVFVNEGDAVRKGQVLATLDLTEINASLSQAGFALEKAARDLDRVRNLYRDSVATLEQLQNAGTAWEMAQSQMKAVQFNRAFAEIRAPFDGTVLKKFVNPGQVVGTGDPVLRTNGGGSGSWMIKAGVSDKQWSQISNGDKATVHLDAFPGETFSGTVVRKSGTSDPATGAFAVEVVVESMNRKLASGMFASVRIVSGKQQSAWSVPYDAVLEANGNEAFVFITDDKQVAIRRPVTIGVFSNEAVQITSGLEDAHHLIVSGSAYLTDQSRIAVVN